MPNPNQSKRTPTKPTNPNDAWILHREEIDTTQEGTCNVYALIDAFSGFCFGQTASIDQPELEKVLELFSTAKSTLGFLPKELMILKSDPFIEMFHDICRDLNIPVTELTAKELRPYVREFSKSFAQFKLMGATTEDEIDEHSMPLPERLSEIEEQELDAFIPDSYSPCSCSSGKKFKFCCKPIFREIAFAMCAAQDGYLTEALEHMKQAETKVGRTAEVLCRYAICWSFTDMTKTHQYLKETFAVNPNHPRANYLMGIESVGTENYETAIAYYQTAIDHYPKNDRFHLNETYNNLGTAFYSLKRYREAKEVWEQALLLLPSDETVKNNLTEYIYENPLVPKELRGVSPFIKKFL